jgi:hypothetical protein
MHLSVKAPAKPCAAGRLCPRKSRPVLDSCGAPSQVAESALIVT